MYCVLKRERPFLNGVVAIIVGAILLVAGSVVCSTYAKLSIQSYLGFSVLAAGIIVTVIGAFKTAEGIFRRILSKELRYPKWLPPRFADISPAALFRNLQIVSYGVALALVGSVTASLFAKYSIENYVGFGLLLTGAAAIIFGVVGVSAAYILGVKHATPMFSGFRIMADGLALCVVGSIIAQFSAKYTAENYVGFGMLLIGVFPMSFGVFKVINEAIKEYLNKARLTKTIRVNQKSLFRSLWVVAFAVAACLVGFTVANEWAIASILNYVGYSLLLLGTVTLLLGHGGIVIAFTSPYLLDVKSRQMLYAKLETTELDKVEDAETKNLIDETETKLAVFLGNRSHITIDDLAYNLGLSTNLTKKFLLRSLQRNTLSGYLTLDGQTYYSSNGLRKNLAELLCKE